MITLLRRIRKSLIESGSTRKYLLYAIGEIALVVIGILIALQINNWNEWRKDRETEEKILHEIIENLETNLARLDINIARGETDNEYTDVVISFIEKEIPYSDTLDKFFPLALNAVDEGSFLSYVGYESLKNTGFEIIQNDLLKKEIITLFEVTYKDLRSRYDRIEWGSAELRKFLDQHFYLKVRIDEAARKGYREFTPFDFDVLVKGNRLMSWLLRLKGFRLWIAEILQDSYDETEKVLQQIKDELGKKDN